ncbi:MAG: Hsp20 family protein [Candidatus Pacebacteria bacterium]|nr:Hsp20 family protein [Candidatus Paceibacterota bacterium]PIR63528.1 MAG: hypothetical protein COU64_04070 [Candidatus Pacebacteria bacterium CG10_big_fil_rev_8_21_14_0_10_40_26]PIZ79409.1 MAG: hypothetical protein COY01_01010 [Candidatus Pacebacteria bacterium CG_4_10_14_0_2_um_filter_40_20]PJA68562.1 MAG: hypothetical protein CO156_04700 [Candidatus Pacebacteria bacterium CG_4_9_14_3_um_filter_40_12]PJC41946.1 MAG: hypothetical protein CO041_01955 [Candidatus Pacebacteria bacterium CG_4_9_
MSNLVPFKSMFHTLGGWPSIWEDDDFQIAPSVNNNLDVYETDNEVVVKANVAGVTDDDIEVTFEKGVLWIQAKSSKEDTDQPKYYSKSSWSYSYKIAVPGMIDHSKEPELTVTKGILKIVFTKSEASKPKKLTIKKQ